MEISGVVGFGGEATYSASSNQSFWNGFQLEVTQKIGSKLELGFSSFIGSDLCSLASAGPFLKKENGRSFCVGAVFNPNISFKFSSRLQFQLGNFSPAVGVEENNRYLNPNPSFTQNFEKTQFAYFYGIGLDILLNHQWKIQIGVGVPDPSFSDLLWSGLLSFVYSDADRDALFSMTLLYGGTEQFKNDTSERAEQLSKKEELLFDLVFSIPFNSRLILNGNLDLLHRYEIDTKQFSHTFAFNTMLQAPLPFISWMTMFTRLGALSEIEEKTFSVIPEFGISFGFQEAVDLKSDRLQLRGLNNSLTTEQKVLFSAQCSVFMKENIPIGKIEDLSNHSFGLGCWMKI